MAQSSDEISRELGRTGDTDASAPVPPAPTADELRSQIEATRAEMSETIDALQERLSPSHLAARAKEAVKDATVGRAKHLAERVTTKASYGGPLSYVPSDVLEKIKNNPLPVALLSIGVAGLVFRMITRRRRRTMSDRRTHRAKL